MTEKGLQSRLISYARVSAYGQTLTRPKAGGGRQRASSIWTRPPFLTFEQQAEARQRSAEGATLREIKGSYDVSAAAISRLGA